MPNLKGILKKVVSAADTASKANPVYKGLNALKKIGENTVEYVKKQHKAGFGSDGKIKEGDKGTQVRYKGKMVPYKYGEFDPKE